MSETFNIRICLSDHVPSIVPLDELEAGASRILQIRVTDSGHDSEALITNDPDIARASDVPVLFTGTTIPDSKDERTFPAFPMRFRPDLSEPIQSFRAGNLGRAGLVRMHIWKDKSTGVAFHEKAGAIDLCMEIFGGDSPDSVFWPQSSDGTYGRINQAVHLGFPCGGMAIIDFGEIEKMGDGYDSFTLIGSHGAAYADDHRNRNLVFSNGTVKAAAPDYFHVGTIGLIHDFVERVRENHSPQELQKRLSNISEILEMAGGVQ